MIAFQSVFPPFRGGISRFSDHLYKNLSQNLPVRAFNYSALYPKMLFPGKTQYLDDRNHTYANPILHGYNPFQWGRTTSKMIHQDTLVYLYSHWHPFFAASQISILKRIKTYFPQVVTASIIHNIQPHENFPVQDILTRRLFKLTDHPIVLSEQTHHEFRTLMDGQNPERLFHPVYEQDWPKESRESIRKRLGFKEDEIVVLFFGLIRPYKGLDILVDALNMMNLENTRIRPLIVGEFYIEPQQIINRIKKSHLPYYEIINRYVSDEEAAFYLTASDVMVLPYKSASQSGVLSNAINFNLPTIVSDLGGLTEHVKYGETGFIVPPADAVSLAKELLHVAKSVNLNEMSKNVEKLRGQLSWKRFTRELVNVVALGDNT